MKARIVLWLIRHPMAAVALALAVVAALSVGLANTLSSGSPPPERPAVAVAVDGGTAESTLPAPTQVTSKSRVEEVHRALHAMGRACESRMATRDPESIRRPVEAMEQFARDFPNGGFAIDDESASTLSLLVVLRSELQNCDPSLVAGVDDLLPQRYRDPS